MYKESGNISIHTENMLPIIKKWLYSDKDIFVRELISNGCDAISKFKRLASMGEAQVSDDTKFEVKVVVNKDEKWIKIIDNGLGMTAEEVKKYINQVAFSGAEEFITKHKGKTDDANEIIGHFGLGFYSAFMVAESVEIDTLSYQEGAEAVRWVCTGGTEFDMAASGLNERGTTITLNINEDNLEFLEVAKLRETIAKHCAFLPIEIYLEDALAKKKEITEKKEGEEEVELKPINNTHPLWQKSPKDCTDEEYKQFYKDVFHDYNDPLFWIHLNVDYPFNLKGILYFPKLKHEFDASEGVIKLYNNQVFVADNIKEIIPEFLMLLKGVVDCPDLPLNVSRSFLQKDKNVTRISKHISKKVADKLTELYKNETEKYNNFWDDINPFVKYGCLRDESFYEMVKEVLIFKTTSDEYVTLKQYLEKNKEKHENKVFYVSDDKQQAQYIKLFKEHDLEAIVLNTMIDNHFVSFLESHEQGVTFNRIDSDISDTMKEADSADETSEEKEASAKVLEKIFKDALGNDKLIVQVEKLKTVDIPAMMLLSEQSRRMQEMSKMFGGGMDMKNMFPEEQILVINKNNALINKVIKLALDDAKKDDVKMICEHVYDLAMLSHKQLDAEAMSKFIARSNTILGRI